MTIQQYIDILNTRYKTGISREHSYRSDLQVLISALAPNVLVTNEPARVACGAPDYIITKNDIPVGYIEAKDIGVVLNSKSLKEQFDRYRASLDNLIITDYLDFHLYIDGEFKTSVKIGEIQNGQIHPLPENFAMFEGLMKDFCTHIGQTIKSSRKLAEMMAAKARMLADVIEKALNSDEENHENSTLQEQMNAFQQILIHDIKTREFADIYAQTIAYGMFAARLHDPSLSTFSRQEAAQLIPKSNPFLRTLFQYIAGYDLDSRIVWIVDGLADLFRATDIAALLKNFGKATQTHDPIIHFYETFLAEYDPKLRKARGVWYTPEPVVNFIVRAVDDILKTEFNLPQGLADTSKTKVKLNIPTHDKRYKAGQREIEHEVHKVQILDPATGTGTFLAEVVKHIHGKYKSMQGVWSSYVENHLIPRLNGFELLMASYAMAHLKLDLLLGETGYKPTKDQRFRIYLTNSLEEHHPDTGSLFATALANEANEANHIKRDTPVMCVIGNPPYSGESANKGEWIMRLMEDYKKEPGDKVKLKEKNSKWINDDYVKFIRYGQHFIERNGEGVLAFINPHGFLENPTFRGMRWNLLRTYDKIYTIDLHGNSKKKEVSPDGSPDVNVFDIQQGVSINLFIKTGEKKAGELGKVYHFDLFGKREVKYDFLVSNSLKTIPFNELQTSAPNYYFFQKDFDDKPLYDKGFMLLDLFKINGAGVTTAHDEFVVDESDKVLLERFTDFKNSPSDAKLLHRTFNVKEKKGWDILAGWNNLQRVKELSKYVVPFAYRPFDKHYIFYENKLVWRTVQKVMEHFIVGDNLGLSLVRRSRSNEFLTPIIVNGVTDKCYSSSLDNSNTFPLYLYPESSTQINIHDRPTRTPNLDKKIVQQIAEKVGLKFTSEKANTPGTFAPIDILDYIYAVLHSPSYREKYKEFLKIDFPRVPYPTDADEFLSLVELGGKLRQIHLLESADVENYITSYPADGNNIVDKPRYENGNVYINDNQYFADVPQTAWEFYIGGYQPAQKWLKDRKGRELTFEDILHYQKIIVALTETDRLMREIDEVMTINATEETNA
ncbi:DNA methyltransferase [Pontibacter qinzhouensis]|uniref:site-specific DNA-methyltransferase (adenine-specific) n=1 Tax=Pontibacter qinzhouensis TaxID=2603253 RepID=A0A5C8J2L6_9BACT|nr:type ISP restriction/modification enzyme [Pontibacter qinzhouensis]TXK30866.1 DNA methyltransferase [Pontibacter qinzhouensis]